MCSQRRGDAELGHQQQLGEPRCAQACSSPPPSLYIPVGLPRRRTATWALLRATWRCTVASTACQNGPGASSPGPPACLLSLPFSVLVQTVSISAHTVLSPPIIFD